jgi:magnesium transporter
MLTPYMIVDGVLVKSAAIDDKTVWLDLLNPTKDEDLLVEKALGVAIPTREEMQEIEASSRIYQERGAHYMTAVVLNQKDLGHPQGKEAGEIHKTTTMTMTDMPIATPVTFVLSNNRLVTVRYEQPRAFSIFLNRNQKGDLACPCAVSVMIGLLEAIVDREADRIERMQTEVDRLGQTIFTIRTEQGSRNRSFDLAIKTIGREGELTSRSHECLQTLERIMSYLAFVLGERNEEKSLKARVKTASRDVNSLNDQVNYLSLKVQFLLDATLGLINIEQNNIIKFFTVVSVALMPPTLIASLYGMNFKHMPELDWSLGYPMAIAMMVVSAVIPFAYFRRKGWM